MEQYFNSTLKQPLKAFKLATLLNKAEYCLLNIFKIFSIFSKYSNTFSKY